MIQLSAKKTSNYSIQFNSLLFNSILYYLYAVPTAARPITDTAQCKKKWFHTGQKQHKFKHWRKNKLMNIIKQAT
jgi:hypothetical protein